MTRTDDIPNGWAASPLGAIRADRSTSVDPSKSPSEYFELYSIPAFPSGHPEIIKGEEIGSTKKILAPGTVIVSKINPHINRVWVVGEHSHHRQIGSSEWIPFFPVGGVEPKYLAYYMRQDAFRNYLAANVSGVGGSLMRVRPATVDPYPIVIAPEDEQHRIVEVIESYFTRLDDAVATLERVQRNLKRYRASVLKAAVEGRLVPTEAELACAEGRDYEPASVLLERILVERRRRWEAAELAKMTAKGKTPKDDTWKAKYKEPASLDSSALDELPAGWCWVHFGTVISVRGGFAFKSGDYLEDPTGVPLIRQSELRTSKVNITAAKHLPLGYLDEFSDKYGIQEGDILVGLSGSLSSVSVYQHDRPALQNQRTGLLRVSQLISKDYVLCTYLTVIAEIEKAGKGVAVQNVSPKQIEALLVPLSPVAEQERIIAEVERHTSLIKDAEQTVSANALRCERLRQSVLKWAFEGKLVDQDVTDESATTLLERIQVEREAPAESKPKARSRHKARSTKP